MKLIVGLGNPGVEYKNTRHSLGFEFIDLLAKRLETTFQADKSLRSEIAKTNFSGEKIILLKPQTFMNLSGEAVRGVVNYYGFEPKDVIVACDDTYLEPGVVRIRLGGASGGHNGLKSIIEELSEQFWRIRLGIGSSDIALEDYVLSKIPESQRKVYSVMIDKAVEEVVMFISKKNIENKTIN